MQWLSKEILSYCIAFSKALISLQHLKNRFPSFLKKLQGSLVKFLVLEEDSSNIEGLPFGVDFYISNLRGDLEELSMLAESFLGFDFYFSFPMDV